MYGSVIKMHSYGQPVKVVVVSGKSSMIQRLKLALTIILSKECS